MSIEDQNLKDKYLMIVSKDKPLTLARQLWMQENFEFVPYKDEDGESQMEAETYKAYLALITYMRKKYHYDVDSHSAWRSVETQKKIYAELAEKYGEEWAKSHVAIPGTSEHHTGLAFDLRFKPCMVPEAFREKAKQVAKKTGLYTRMFKIIETEAVQFGFIKRYDDSKKDITGFNGELWHFRYVGVENAKAIYESGMCLEEYVKALELKNKEKEAKTPSRVA